MTQLTHHTNKTAQEAEVKAFCPNRIVIKLGTQLLVSPSGNEQGKLNTPLLVDIVKQIATLQQQGKEVLLVTSGAVGLGRQQINNPKPLTLNEKQACAAIGQSILMDTYRKLFSLYDITVAQVLVTADNFSNREHYLNLQQTLEQLLQWKTIPIINENDVVSSQELKQNSEQEKGFGDNDRLSALVASKLNADLLVILTNVDGVFTDNPQTNPEAKFVNTIQTLTELNQINAKGSSNLGRGGMQTKLEAGRIAAISGIYTFIANGTKENIISHSINTGDEKQAKGTWIYPFTELNGKKRWIGLASGFQGKIEINTGAINALQSKNASLLPIGITNIEGAFPAEQVVSIQDEKGNEIGRGISNFSSEQLNSLKGLHSDEVSKTLSNSSELTESGRNNVAIFRENLVLFESYD